MIVTSSKINITGYNFMKPFLKKLQFNNCTAIPDSFNELIGKMENAANHNEVLDILYKNVEKGELELKNGVLFKHGEYIIQNMFKDFGNLYEYNLKKVNNLGLDIAPEHIKTIIKDNDMFLITKIKGTKNGDLIPYCKVKEKVSRKNKLAAFSDMQKLTKAGLADDKILHSSDIWFATPDDNRIVIPSFERLRPLSVGENQKALECYHNIIFN